MKKLSILFFLFTAFYCNAQMEYPTHWVFSSEEKKDGTVELQFKIDIDDEWHIYSQFTPDGGPLPMVYTFEKSDCYSRIGKVVESKPIEEFDSIFGVKVILHHEEAIFRQVVKLKEPSCRIKGKIDYQACKEVCINQDTSFVFNIGTSKNDKIEIPQDTTSEIPKFVVVTPDKTPDNFTPDKDAVLEPGCGEGTDNSSGASRTFLGIFIAGMLGGLLALLTPCVFPMIPMTVSFFTKRSGSRRKGIANAFIYAGSIILIYVALGLLVTIMFGSDALNDLSSNAFFNLAFFVIFVIFAISFFGAFEITLPSWIINKADSASDRGGLIGIFFMAFTLSLVSFSCTGPIIGTLLVEAAQGQSYIGPLAGMTGRAGAGSPTAARRS